MPRVDTAPSRPAEAPRTYRADTLRRLRSSTLSSLTGTANYIGRSYPVAASPAWNILNRSAAMEMLNLICMIYFHFNVTRYSLLFTYTVEYHV